MARLHGAFSTALLRGWGTCGGAQPLAMRCPRRRARGRLRHGVGRGNGRLAVRHARGVRGDGGRGRGETGSRFRRGRTGARTPPLDRGGAVMGERGPHVSSMARKRRGREASIHAGSDVVRCEAKAGEPLGRRCGRGGRAHGRFLLALLGEADEPAARLFFFLVVVWGGRRTSAYDLKIVLLVGAGAPGMTLR